jgi:hypothetical protein
MLELKRASGSVVNWLCPKYSWVKNMKCPLVSWGGIRDNLAPIREIQLVSAVALDKAFATSITPSPSRAAFSSSSRVLLIVRIGDRQKAPRDGVGDKTERKKKKSSFGF